MNANEIVEVFQSTFPDVRLTGGNEEPFYAPAGDAKPATIYFKEDFAASALHEAAHWCIAGMSRRQLPDFGYWYEPERDAATQARFEETEAGPQALEWILSNAAGRSFRVSFDNFGLPTSCLDAFRERVRESVVSRLDKGLPPRASRFADALSARSGCENYLDRRLYEELPC